MKILCILATVFLVLGSIWFCDNNVPGYKKTIITYADNSHYPVTIETFNSKGKSTPMIFTHSPKRVVTDELNTFETLLALGLGDCIVESSVSSNSQIYQRLKKEYPEELEKVKGISTQDLNTESVLAISPDFILGWKSTFTSQLKKSTDWWNQRGINTYVVATSNHVLNYGTIEDECQFLADIGKIFNVEKKTNYLIQEIHDEVCYTREQTKERSKQFVMVIEMSGRAFMNYDNGWLVGDMVEQLGGEMPVKGRRIGYEDLIDYNPDVIFVVYFNDKQKEQIINLFQKAQFSSLKAVKEHRIYPLPFDHMYTTAIKTKDGIRMIRDGLYPDLVND